MQKMENFAVDILKNLFKILAINMVSYQLSLLKNKMSSMVASQYFLIKWMFYTKLVAVLHYLAQTMAICTNIMVVYLGQVYSTKKFVILWLLKKGFRALLTLGSQPCFLGEECLVSLGEECHAALWGENAKFPRGRMPCCSAKLIVRLCRTSQLSFPEDYQLGFPCCSAKLIVRLCRTSQLGFPKDCQLGSPDVDFSLASQKRTSQPCFPKKSQPSSGTLTLFCWWSVSAEMSASTCIHVFLHIQKLVSL